MSRVVILPCPTGSSMNSSFEFVCDWLIPLLHWTCCIQAYGRKSETLLEHTKVGSGPSRTTKCGHTCIKQLLNFLNCTEYDKLWQCYCSYQAGVLFFSFWFMSSPAYLSELLEYLYVGGKYILPHSNQGIRVPLFAHSSAESIKVPVLIRIAFGYLFWHLVTSPKQKKDKI